MMKPKLFVASSVESLSIAEAVNVNLDHDFEVTLWRNGTFKLSSTTINDLLMKASSVDFSLFVFAPEDLATIRESTHHITRDNVVFELGLFIGSIGKERCFILKPRDEDMHLPSDLVGMNFADFNANRTDGDLTSATNSACTQIKSRAKELGRISHTVLPENQRLIANPPDYPLSDIDFKFLSVCLGSHTSIPEGLAFSRISFDIKGVSDALLRISAVKLERLHFVEKAINTDEEYGGEYYSYSITEQGIDLVLKNSERFSIDKEELDDDLPF